jgi:glycosyltransferase involved in cell wall biosynthesis
MKLSLIVPVYNVAPYLCRCLDSLVAQTVEDFEIIAVNDASPDGCLAILQEYAGRYPNVRVIDSKVNLRQGGARNLGIAASSGEFLGFVDGDDRVEPTMYEKLVRKALAEDCDVVDCDLLFTEAGKPPYVALGNSPDQIGEATLERRRTWVLHAERIVTKIYRRGLFLDNAISFPERLAYEDNPVGPLLLAFARRLGKVDEPLYVYYRNPSSTTTTNNSSHHFDRLETSRILLEEFKRRGLYETFKDEVEFRFAELFYINTMMICLHSFDPPELGRLIEIRDYMRTNLPGYRKNRYFSRISRRNRMLSLLNDWSPRLLSGLHRLYKLAR